MSLRSDRKWGTYEKGSSPSPPRCHGGNFFMAHSGRTRKWGTNENGVSSSPKKGHGENFMAHGGRTRSLQWRGEAPPKVAYATEVSQQRMSTLSDIMEALTDDSIIIIGVYGPVSAEKATLLDKVSRRANRDNLFDMVVMTSVSKKPDLKRIQRQIADAFGLTMEEKNIEERAGRLQDRIKMEGKILIILQDLCKGLDLKKLGIPFGANHTGCKILLTSTSEEILSSQMHAQKVFMV